MKVRIKELAQEAKFIRLEETKIKSKQKIYQFNDPNNDQHDNVFKWNNSSDFRLLQVHRTHDVRNAARAAQLAYGFLRGVPYEVIESSSRPMDMYSRMRLVKEVKRLVTKFGYKNYDDEVDVWLNKLLTI